jgi:hypothetical protein
VLALVEPISDLVVRLLLLVALGLAVLMVLRRLHPKA